MLLSPESSPIRHALINTTNVTPERPRTRNPLPTPPDHASAKRPRTVDGDDGAGSKRVKISQEGEGDVEMDCNSDDSDSDAIVMPQRRNTLFHRMNALATSRPRFLLRRTVLPTRSILRSFVSSRTADLFICHSQRVNTFVTPPYACAYSNAAKRGGVPHLAVATEEGTVYIWNTSKRDVGDAVPQRIDLNVHDNGIFDIQWSLSDALIATSSGDASTRITDPITGQTTHVLRGHKGTVKSVVWDPAHEHLLSTGGRDGGICLWDLRSTDKMTGHEDGIDVFAPVLSIHNAHGGDAPAKGRGKKAKPVSSARTVTSLVYPETSPYGLISSGSFDGMLRAWDLRQPTPPKKSKSMKSPTIVPTHISDSDPTTLQGARRSRGISSLVPGSGPSAGLLFGLGIDSRVHTYAASTLSPLADSFAHTNMLTNSFYARLAVSPDGRSLASGGTKGSGFLYDISQISLASVQDTSENAKGFELAGQRGEVGAVDWAYGMLATSSDDGTVRVWRRDEEVRRMCDQEGDYWNWTWAVDRARH